jgi:hypothetical protein
MAQPERRRRRLRHPPTPPGETSGRGRSDDAGPAAAAEPGAMTADTPPVNRPGPETVVHAPEAVHDPETPAASGPRTGSDEREAERGLRGLVGSGASQVGPRAALRARDASRPTDDDLAAAERDLVIIRRNWVPREELPRGR